VERRPIGDAAKVFVASVVLGPPVGGIVALLLASLADMALGNGGLLYVTAAAPLSAIPLALVGGFVIGLPAALVAGLALGGYVGSGHRLTPLACALAALLYPAILLAHAFVTRAGPPINFHMRVQNVTTIAVASVVTALIFYGLFRNTTFVRRLRAPVGA
jgi:hypothetical protein